MENRIVYIDQLKGLAIFLVVTGHIYWYTYSQYQSQIFHVINSFHMPLFIFLSGILAWKENEIFTMHKLKMNIQKKIIPLLFPFLFMGGLFSIYKTGTFSELFINGNMHLGYWFTFVLFQIFIIYYIARYFTDMIFVHILPNKLKYNISFDIIWGV